MGDRTKIQWTATIKSDGEITPGATWNPVTGCTPISEACDHCYAKRMATRLRGRYGYPADEPFRVTLHPGKLDEPLKWEKPRRVFVVSMGDLFHEDVPFHFIASVFGTMHCARQHTYQILTKRPERMKAFIEWFQSDWLGGPQAFATAWPREYQHVWLGVTAESQPMADQRIPLLLRVPAALHWVSFEPLLGAINLDRWLVPVAGYDFDIDGGIWPGGRLDPTKRIDWCVVGGETGPNARPMAVEWARSLRDQCKAAQVPYFFKQMTAKALIPGDLMIRQFPGVPNA